MGEFDYLKNPNDTGYHANFPALININREIVKGVNQVGAAPGDLVAILQALQQAGALRAELIVI